MCIRLAAVKRRLCPLLLQSRLVGGFARNNGRSVVVSSLLLQRRRANLHAHTTKKKNQTRVHKPRVFVGIASNGVRRAEEERHRRRTKANSEGEVRLSLTTSFSICFSIA